MTTTPVAPAAAAATYISATGYAQALATLSSSGEKYLALVAQTLGLGAITQAEALTMIVNYLSIMNGQAVNMAIQAVSITLTDRLGTTVAPTGVTRGDETQRLTLAANKILTESKKPADMKMRLERLGRSEPLDAGQWAFGEALEATAKSLKGDWEADEAVGGKLPIKAGTTIGWVRGLHPEACELCQWLEKDGYVYPPSRKMHHHQGCRCQQIIVTSRDGESRGQRNKANKQQRQQSRAARAAAATTTDQTRSDAA